MPTINVSELTRRYYMASATVIRTLADNGVMPLQSTAFGRGTRNLYDEESADAVLLPQFQAMERERTSRRQANAERAARRAQAEQAAAAQPTLQTVLDELAALKALVVARFDALPACGLRIADEQMILVPPEQQALDLAPQPAPAPAPLKVEPIGTVAIIGLSRGAEFVENEFGRAFRLRILPANYLIDDLPAAVEGADEVLVATPFATHVRRALPHQPDFQLFAGLTDLREKLLALHGRLIEQSGVLA